MDRLKVALGQMNPMLGDLQRNADNMVDFAKRAQAAGTSLLAFGELSLVGYPILDLALDETFVRECERSAVLLAQRLVDEGLGELPVIIGLPTLSEERDPARFPHGPTAHNSAAVLLDGNIYTTYQKRRLANDSVFDEKRGFLPGSDQMLLEIGGSRILLYICEDIWHSPTYAREVKECRPDLVVVLNASPYEKNKKELRRKQLHDLSSLGSPVAYVNLVGAQDGLVFDGDTQFWSRNGTLLSTAKQFTEDILLCDFPSKNTRATEAFPILLEQDNDSVSVPSPTPSNHDNSQQDVSESDVVEQSEDHYQEIWQALTLGLRDYVEKNQFSQVILGLSGGIDSALCAALAVDALGPDRVLGVGMPSKYSSEHSLLDAEDLAKRTGISYRVQSIEPLVAAFDHELHLSGVAAENLQARIRGMILMSISNAEGGLVLTTGNKSEVAVGYSTMYGDSVGGFAPIKDVLKTEVWKLAKWRNTAAERLGHVAPIPENSILKPPSAELSPGQTDQQSLPEYETLDTIISLLIVEKLSPIQTIERGFDPEIVGRVARLLRQSEWKRQQSAPGTRISKVAFGIGRKRPITYKPSRLDAKVD